MSGLKLFENLPGKYNAKIATITSGSTNKNDVGKTCLQIKFVGSRLLITCPTIINDEIKDNTVAFYMDMEHVKKSFVNKISWTNDNGKTEDRIMWIHSEIHNLHNRWRNKPFDTHSKFQFKFVDQTLNAVRIQQYVSTVLSSFSYYVELYKLEKEGQEKSTSLSTSIFRNDWNF